MNKAVYLLLLILLSALQAEGKREVSVFTADSMKNGMNYVLERHWLYSPGDSIQKAAMNYNDSGWISAGTNLPYPDSAGGIGFYGIGWFRLHLYFDSAVAATSLAISLEQSGASEVYFDGKKIVTFGKISVPDSVIYYDPQSIAIPLPVTRAGDHVLAVRYAYYHAQRNYKWLNTDYSGFTMQLGEAKGKIFRFYRQLQVKSFFYLSFFGIFLALSVIHLFLYLYYRKLLTNLYFSIFCLSFGLMFLVFYISRTSTNPTLQLIMLNAITVIVSALCISLSGFIMQLYSVKKWRFRAVLILGIVCVVAFAINRSLGYALYIALVFGVAIQVIVRIVRAIFKKVPGSLILGPGVLFFALFVYGCFTYGLIFRELVFDDSTMGGFLLLLGTFIAILGLPISISMFLAWSFSKINRDLNSQLIKNQQLSQTALEQEAEKKEILERQNAELEQKVSERTNEVMLQKEVIEQKNRAITDNLNYAQRIQSALLPSTKLIYQTLKECFIIFQPKDIVSGDFYSFYEKNGKALIVAADCTGHGVSGAFMSMIGSSLINQIINEKGVEAPAEILNQLNTAVIDALKQGENDSHDGMDVGICSFDPTLRTVQFAGANRPLWLVRGNELIVYKPDKFPIGGLQMGRNRNYNNQTMELQTGDTLYLFSDGYADQFGGDHVKKMTTSRFKELLLSIQQLDMKTQNDHMKAFLKTWMGDHEQLDDILVIGIRV